MATIHAFPSDRPVYGEPEHGQYLGPVAGLACALVLSGFMWAALIWLFVR